MVRFLQVILFLVLPALPSLAQVNVSGIISTDVIWTAANSPYIITGNTIVSSGIDLTIEPGVTVKFESSTVLRVDGQLRAIGTETDQVVFTSNQVSPDKGDWGHILYTDQSMDAQFSGATYASGNILKNCVLEYGGSLGKGIVSIDRSSPYFSKCVIRYSASDGVNADHGSFSMDSSAVYDNNNKGIYLYRYPPNDVSIVDSEVYNNPVGGIHFENIHDANTTIEIDGNAIYENQGTGGIHFDEGQNSRIIISNNEIKDNQASRGGGFYSEGGEIRFFKNHLEGNSAPIGGAVAIDGDFAAHNYDFEENYFYDNSGTSSVILFNFVATNYATTISFLNNEVSTNSSTGNIISMAGDAAQDRRDITYHVSKNKIFNNTCTNLIKTEYFKGSVTNNNFISNTSSYIINNSNTSSMLNVDASGNYWGTSVEAEISAFIYDFFDDGNLSFVNYSPFQATEIDFDAIQAPSNLTLITATANFAIITWTDNSDNETNFVVERALNENFESIQRKDTLGSNKTLLWNYPLESYTQYFFRAYAYNENAVSDFSETLFVQTQDTVYAPSDLTLVDSSPESISISWTDNSDNELKFVIESALSEGFETVVKDTLDENTTSFVSHGLEANTSYHFRLHAFNENVKSSFSETLLIQTQDTVYAPSNVTLVDASAESATISWTDNSDNELKFVVESASSEDFEIVVKDTLDENTTSFVSNGLEPNTLYYFRLHAFNENVKSGFSETLLIQTLDTIYAPYGLTLVDASAESATISWTDNSDNELMFVVERALNEDFEIIVKDTLDENTTSFLSHELEANTPYYFRLHAFNANVASDFSEVLGIQTQDTVYAPSELTLVDASAESITITWVDNSDNESNFVIERAMSEDFETVVKDTLDENTTSFVSNGLEPNTLYYFRLHAFNENVKSGFSETLLIQTLDTIYAPSNVTLVDASAESATISWTDNSDNELKFVVERALSGDFEIVVKDTLDENTTSFLSHELEANTPYYFRLHAFSANVASDFSKVLSIQTQDTVYAPSELTLVDASAESITITWVDNSDNESNFVIERAMSEGFETVVKDTLDENTTSFVSHGLEANTSYYFRLHAFNQNAISDYSNVMSTTTVLLSTFGPGNELQVYPNPTDHFLTVDQANIETDFELKIYDHSGRVYSLPNHVSSSHSLTIDVNPLPAGHYVLKIISRTSSRDVRFIKK